MCPHLFRTRDVISADEGGFSPRPSVCSASWMSAATTCVEFCCQVHTSRLLHTRTTRLPGSVTASAPLAHDFVSLPSTKTSLAKWL
jgi:hypothetical protein